MAQDCILTAKTLTLLKNCRSIVVKSELGPDSQPTTSRLTIYSSDDRNAAAHMDRMEPSARVNHYGLMGSNDKFANGYCSVVISNYPNQMNALGTVWGSLKPGDRKSTRLNSSH